jgi:hypothetical protein
MAGFGHPAGLYTWPSLAAILGFWVSGVNRLVQKSSVQRFIRFWRRRRRQKLKGLIQFKNADKMINVNRLRIATFEPWNQ